MCGIIGIVGKTNVYTDIVDCLKALEYRGYDSAGIAMLNGKLTVRKGVGNVSQVFGNTEELPGNIGIGHTRWATHGGVTDFNAHPHTDCTGDIAICHNGIIDNYQDLKNKLQGHIFKSDTDSEVIAHLIEHTGLTHEEAMFAIADTLEGQYAIVAVSRYSDKLLAMRRGSPLVVGIGHEKNYVVSDPNALPADVKQIVPINDNELVMLDYDSYQIYNLDTRDIIFRDPEYHKPTANVDMTVCRMEYEMLEQPEIIRNICLQDKKVIMDMAIEILKAQHVILIGCGTSKHAALAGRFALSSIANKLCEVMQASELEYFTNSIDKRTLIIALSQSGETSDVIRAVQIAKAQGCKILSLVNAPMSSLERISDYTLSLCCGPEISVASTKAFTAQICTLYLLSYAMQNNLERGITDLMQLGDILGAEVANQKDSLQFLSQILQSKPGMFYLGRGVNYPLACEGALKMKEIAYIQAESYPGGELKHGPIALIEHGFPVLGVCPKDDTYVDMLANLHEVKARGAMIIGVSDKQSDIFDHWIEVPSVNKLFYPIVATVPLHILAYLVSVLKGINPDRPRNLAKSVTVR